MFSYFLVSYEVQHIIHYIIVDTIHNIIIDEPPYSIICAADHFAPRCHTKTTVLQGLNILLYILGEM